MLHINTNYLLDLESRSKGHFHSVENYDKQNRPNVRLRLSDETLIDASEYINAVYEDLSQINEILSF